MGLNLAPLIESNSHYKAHPKHIEFIGTFTNLLYDINTNTLKNRNKIM